ncbi:WYL domain-containing protein [Algibacter sp. TI.3.09]|uniref:helix-turn-helix transcriptional regulator n=1 Tax=Algibacter sp. TI.3.09 TaxID=3121298 RepID=UPI00311E9122
MSLSKNKSQLPLTKKRNIVIIIAIHNVLNSLKSSTKEELKKEVNLDLRDYSLDQINDVRTIEKGIDTLEKLLEINILKEGKPVVYKYKTRNIKIAKQLFLHSGMEHMVLMYDVLLSLDGLSFNKLNEKVFHTLGSKGYSKLKELNFFEKENVITPLIQFESHSKFEMDQGKLFLELFDAINQKEVLDLEYKYFNGDIKKYKVSPYLLKQFNKRWFLFVFNHEKKSIDYFGLARIESHTILPKDNFKEKERKCLFGEESYFSDKVGVSKYENRYENLPSKKATSIKIRVEKMQFNYIETKPIHDSQKWHKNEGDDEYEVISIDVIINFELIAMLLSFGSTIKIIEPIELRDILIEKYKKALENYE